MFKRKCQECGQRMVFKAGVKIRQFCSKECSDAFHEKEYNHPSTGPVMPHLKAEDITDEGYIALVKAIVARASHDVTHFKPGTRVRVEAEQFFESDYFTALTGLDGAAILRELHREYEERCKHKKPNYSTCKVRCVETGVVYESIKDAADEYGLSPKSIYNVCKGYDKTAAGMHFEYVKEGADGL